MLTYSLKKSPSLPLYEALYRAIRDDILSGALKPGDRLPAKRALAAHLRVSRITVEGAYAQLLAEGYLRSQERVGYFVEALDRVPAARSAPPPAPAPRPRLDLTAGGPPEFPFSVWSRLQREVTLDLGKELLAPMPNQGVAELRQAIADHLGAFRGLAVDPEHILVGAGTDFLCNLLLQLLGRDKRFALEEPGYGKLRRIYTAGGAQCLPAGLDDQGVRPEALGEADVLHFSPAHHFPTGIITTPARRGELLAWAEAGNRYIIEDDYDSEFRAHPFPAISSMDRSGRVIYMNTFSRSLAPAIRIGYLVLPDGLLERLRRELGFYSCTVPSFEQHILARFLKQGYFEKHVNRMRKLYRARRDRVLAAIRSSGRDWTVLEQEAGLHFLLKPGPVDDDALRSRFAQAGIAIRTLSEYYHTPVPEKDRGWLVVNYGDLSEEALEEILKVLMAI